MLTFPRDNTEPFVLDTDASDVAIGGELVQIQDGVERVISYGSYTLSPAQKKYRTTRKELLAVVRFTRQFRHYLRGRQFFVRTDHSSLAWLMRFKLLSGMLARWVEELSQYDMIIVHRKGKNHTNADSLSRIPQIDPVCNCYFAGCSVSDLPCEGCKYCTRIHNQWARFEDDVIPLAVREVTMKSPVAKVPSQHNVMTGILCPVVRPLPNNGNTTESREINCPTQSKDTSDIETPFVRRLLDEDNTSLFVKHTHGQLRELQLADQDLKHLMRWKETSTSPSQAELQILSPSVKYFWTNVALLTISDGVLYYKWVEGDSFKLLFIVPVAMREEFQKLNHDSKMSGHPGITKTLQKLKQTCFWYKMGEDVSLYVKSCKECNTSKGLS